MRTTIKEYAAANNISIGTARRRLEKMRMDGTAEMTIRWEHPERPCYQHQDPPAHKVNVYILPDDQEGQS